jgi:hypothetical protein
MNEKLTPPVIEETDLVVPAGCAGCGTKEDVKLFGFKTSALNANRQIIPYCRDCTLRVADFLYDLGSY